MSKHVGSFGVGIIGNYEAFRDLYSILMEIFQDLNRLRAWSGTHIQTQMMRLDV